MPEHNFEAPSQSRPDIIKRTGDMLAALQQAGYDDIEILDGLLCEAGWLVEAAIKGWAATMDKDEVRRLVSEFSEICTGLIAPERPFHPGHH